LRGRAHVADLVEENGSLVRLLETADPKFLRTGKGPALVPEQLALEQVFIATRRNSPSQKAAFGPEGIRNG